MGVTGGGGGREGQEGGKRREGVGMECRRRSRRGWNLIYQSAARDRWMMARIESVFCLPPLIHPSRRLPAWLVEVGRRR